MAKLDIDTIHNASLYLISKGSEKFIVAGKEINQGVQQCRFPNDTIVLLQTKSNYRVGDSILTGKEIIEKASAVPVVESLPGVAMWGVFFLGIVIGWNLYFINRYRKRESIVVGDLTTVISAIGGLAVLTLLKNDLCLIGYYGMGVGVGFFLYLAFLVYLSTRGNADDNYKFPNFFLKVHPDQNPAVTNYTQDKS